MEAWIFLVGMSFGIIIFSFSVVRNRQKVIKVLQNIKEFKNE